MLHVVNLIFTNHKLGVVKHETNKANVHDNRSIQDLINEFVLLILSL